MVSNRPAETVISVMTAGCFLIQGFISAPALLPVKLAHQTSVVDAAAGVIIHLKNLFPDSMYFSFGFHQVHCIVIAHLLAGMDRVFGNLSRIHH